MSLRVVLCLALLAVVSGSLHAQEQDNPAFRRVRGSFAVMDIPSDATGGDGNYILVRNGLRSTIAMEEASPHVDIRQPECQGAKPVFVINKAKVFAYSCIIGNMVRYHVEKYGRTYRMGAGYSRDQIAYTIRYPDTQNAYFAKVVQHMTGSLQFAYEKK